MAYESRIPEIVDVSLAEVAKAIQKAGYRIEAGAKRRARVDTGFMRGEIQFHPGADPFHAEVLAGANYTIFHEFGTRYMSAQPMLIPAAEEARPEFVEDIRKAFR